MLEIKKCRNIVFIFLLVLPCVTFSQTQQGAILAGGAFSFNIQKIKEKENNIIRELGRESILQFNPTVGYFLIDGVAAGLMINWQRQAIKYTDDVKEVSHATTIGPFGRFYTQLGPFFQAQLSLGGGSDKITDETQTQMEYPFKLVSWGLGIGYPYFLNENVSIEPLILFRAQNRTRDYQNADDEVLKYRGVSIQVGFVYYLF